VGQAIQILRVFQGGDYNPLIFHRIAAEVQSDLIFGTNKSKTGHFCAPIGVKRTYSFGKPQHGLLEEVFIVRSPAIRTDHHTNQWKIFPDELINRFLVHLNRPRFVRSHTYISSNSQIVLPKRVRRWSFAPFYVYYWILFALLVDIRFVGSCFPLFSGFMSVSFIIDPALPYVKSNSIFFYFLDFSINN